MFDDPSSLLAVLLRFGHIIFGIIWLGHLFFFNLVNVPFQADLDKELKPKVNPKLLLRAFYWFRWGAMYTFLFGWAIFFYKYIDQGLLMENGHLSNRAAWILFGGLIGTVMWFNVWFVIWPRQKKIIGAAQGGPAVDPSVPKQATLASKINTYLSVPLLLGMMGAHEPAYEFPMGRRGLLVGILIGLAVVWVFYKLAPKVN